MRDASRICPSLPAAPRTRGRGPNPVVTRAQLEAIRAQLIEEGAPHYGYGTIARIALCSVATVRRRLGRQLEQGGRA
jgi:hypothetical protein